MAPVYFAALIGFTAGVGLVLGAQMLRGYVEDYRRGRAIRARRDGLGRL